MNSTDLGVLAIAVVLLFLGIYLWTIPIYRHFKTRPQRHAKKRLDK